MKELLLVNPKKTNVNVFEEDCLICCESFESPYLVTCFKCNNKCCKTCFQKYILLSNLEPSCMFCGKKLDVAFILFNSNIKWFETIYKEHRKEKLWKNELVLIQDVRTQAAAKAYITAKEINENYIYRIDDDLKIFTSLYLNIVENAKECITNFGIGWENYDFDNNVPRLDSSPNISFPCPIINCRGIITNKTCGICGNDICSKCREKMKNENEHICNEDALKSIKSLVNNSHPCPKCATPISKVSGCDQMFCTQCHTTFSWDNGRIITHNFHNPHYFEWIFTNNRLQQPIPLENENKNICDEFISYQNLMQCFTPQEKNDFINSRKKIPQLINFFEELSSATYYALAFIKLRENILNVRAYSGNHVNIGIPNNHKLRIKLLSNEINENEFKMEIEKKDMKHNKYRFYWEVYSTVFEFTSILFGNLYVYTHKRTGIKKKRKDYFHEIYIHIQNILDQANKQIDYYNNVFGKDKRLINFNQHPFI